MPRVLAYFCIDLFKRWRPTKCHFGPLLVILLSFSHTSFSQLTKIQWWILIMVIGLKKMFLLFIQILLGQITFHIECCPPVIKMKDHHTSHLFSARDDVMIMNINRTKLINWLHIDMDISLNVNLKLFYHIWPYRQQKAEKHNKMIW